MSQAEHYRTQAELARTEAERATLDNVRDRCLRSMAAWQTMADRAERQDRERAVRELAKLES